MRYDDVIAFVAFPAAAVPVLVCMARGRAVSLEAWWIAGAFAVSFLMDGLSLQLAHFQQPNAWVGYYGYPLQFGILLGVVAPHRPVRRAMLTMLAVVAITSFFRDTLDKPETFVRVVGGITVGWLAWGVSALRVYWPALWIYGILTIPYIVLMGRLPYTHALWLPVWAVYEGLRIVAVVLLVWVLTRREAAHGNLDPARPVDRPYRNLRVLGGGSDFLGARPVAQGTQR